MFRLTNTNGKHVLAVDLESWVFSRKIDSLALSIDKLRLLEDRYIYEVLDYILPLLKKHKQKITFFVVTKLEELYPGLFDRIKKDGHEIGWHTHTHARVDNVATLVKELEMAKDIITSYNMKGFQAPEIFFFKGGYKILKQYGFTYSSSLYGNSGYVYTFDGIAEWPVSVSNRAFAPKAREIVFPCNLSFLKLLSYHIPFGSGLFWGILGKNYYLKKIDEMTKRRESVNMFIHDWQLVRPKAKGYKKDVSFFWNPLFTPYKIDVDDLFELLLTTYKFQPMRDVFL